MATWLKVTLDTTPPTVELFLPFTTTNESYEHVFLIANENLDIKHEFYIIDSLGQRHNYVLALEDDKKSFFGRISFHAFPKGIATAYFKVYDSVWNSSALLTKSFSVVDPHNIKMFLSEHIIDIETEILTRKLDISSKESELIMSESTMPVILKDDLEEGDA